MHNLFHHVYPIELSTGVAVSDTSTDVTFEYQDTRGYQGVSFVLHLNDTTNPSTATWVYAEMCGTTDGTAVEVYGSSALLTTGWAGDSGLFVIDVFNPSYRYVRPMWDRTSTGQSVISAVALLSRAHLMPVSYSSAKGVIDVQVCVGSSS